VKGTIAPDLDQQRDWRFIAATSLWSNGDLGLICKDDNVLNRVAAQKKAPALAAPAGR
jgi:hypothetical protein